MLSEKINQTYQKYPKLRILFFFDPTKEFEADFESIDLAGIRKIRVNKNIFNLKVKLNGEWEEEKVFLYLQQPSPQNENDNKAFPLLDFLVANRELRLDDASAFIEQFQLLPHHRSLVARFIRELQYKSVQEVAKPILTPKLFDEQNLSRALISAFLKFGKPEDWNIILARLLTLLQDDGERSRLAKRINDNGLFDTLVSKYASFFNVQIPSLDRQDLINLLNFIKYNLITRDITVPAKSDPYSSLKASRASVIQNLIIFREQVQLHPKVGPEFQKAIEHFGTEIKEDTLILNYGVEAPYLFITDKLRWEIISHSLIDLTTSPAHASATLLSIDMQGVQSSSLTKSLEFLKYVTEMLIELDGISSYILDTPDEYVIRYTKKFYRVDNSFRKAITEFNLVDETELPKTDFLRNAYSILNNRYNEFLEKINREWLRCLNEIGFDYSRLKTEKQYNFYEKEIRNEQLKVAVIISDALRYEVGVELMKELNTDIRSQAEIDCVLASVPSITRMGMANLLHGSKYIFEKDTITIDNLGTNSLEDRQRLLAALKPGSRAVTYDEVVQKSENENRELFKSPVVYIYHNVIDATGDKRNSERRTFSAVVEALDEIKKLVKKLHSSLNVSNVLVTSDHGFLYNDSEIADKDLQQGSGLETFIAHNRFEVLKNKAEIPLTYCFPISKTTKLNDQLSVIIPRSVNRFRRQGSGQQYVHGGASLQEIIVPIVYSIRKRKDIASKVTLVLISKPLKVVSNILKVTILQEKAISHSEKERTILVGLYRDLDLVSGQVELTLDSTSENPLQRSNNFELALLPGATSSTWLKLKVFDKEDLLNPIIDEVVENNTLINKDF